MPEPDTAHHGLRVRPPPVESLLWDDPDLAFVEADMAAYMEAHPCRCGPDCACDEECDCPCH